MHIILIALLSLNWPHFECSVAPWGEWLSVPLTSDCGWWCSHRPTPGCLSCGGEMLRKQCIHSLLDLVGLLSYAYWVSDFVLGWREEKPRMAHSFKNNYNVHGKCNRRGQCRMLWKHGREGASNIAQGRKTASGLKPWCQTDPGSRTYLSNSGLTKGANDKTFQYS